MAVGEWVTSNVLFSAAFLVALLGIVGIAVYVLRGDRINRAAMGDPGDDLGDHALHAHGDAERVAPTHAPASEGH